MKFNNKSSIINIILLFSILTVSFFSIGFANAVVFDNNNSSSDVQNQISNTGESEIIFKGNFSKLSNINITRNITIKGNNEANIKGPGSGALFNIQSSNVVIEGLNISGYNTAINNDNAKKNIIIRNNQISTIKTAIESTGDNISIYNNKIYTSGSEYHGIYIHVFGPINSCEIYKNIINTKGYKSKGVHIASPSTIQSNVFNNTILTLGNESDGIYFEGAGSTSGNIYENIIDTSGELAYGIYIYSTNKASGNIYSNTVYSRGKNSLSIAIASSGNTVNGNIYNNNITILGDNIGGIDLRSMRMIGTGSTVTGNVFNNTINSSGRNSHGIYYYSGNLKSPNGIISNANIYGNNILSNSIAICLNSSVISNNTISYNRILDSTYHCYLNINNNSNLLFANWFGNNTLDITKFRNINILNYYVINATLTGGPIGGNWTIHYWMHLNGSSDNQSEIRNLPDFYGNITDYADYFKVFLTKEDFNDKILIDFIGEKSFNLKVDNQILTLSSNSYKDSVKINVNIIGDKIYDEKGQIIVNLRNSYDLPLAQQTIELWINGEFYGVLTTDNDGIGKIDYIYNKAGNNTFEFRFNETSIYNGTSTIENVNVSKAKAIIDFKYDTKTSYLIAKMYHKVAIKGETIDFYLGGKYIGSAITNNDGIAKLYYPLNNTGKYVFTANFNGNDNFLNIFNELRINIPKNNTNNTNNTNKTNKTNDTNRTNESNKINDINNNLTKTNAIMKQTGIPIIAIIFVLLTSLGLIVRKK